ncbi:MAG TPA: hypothetical protein VKZ63_19760 [Kofleriaceae bacterium]|nr:hypothetical protein [Kofleriaceae bacterium]
MSGDAEGEGGWVFSGVGTGEGSLVDGAGAGGSRAAQVRVRQNCDSAAMETPIAFPAEPGTALELWWRATDGAHVGLWTPPFLVAYPSSDGEAHRMRMCVPEALLGTAQRLTATLQAAPGGSCGEPRNLELSVDEVRLVADPACARSGGVVDGGFESLLLPFGAGHVRGNSVVAVDSAELAHGGDGVLELTTASTCNSSFIERWIVTPPAGAEGGPAFRFWHDTPDLAESTASVSVHHPAPTARPLPEGSGWAEEVVCLDPELAGLLTRIVVRLSGGGGACNVPYAPESIRLDDLSIGPDPRCPAE